MLQDIQVLNTFHDYIIRTHANIAKLVFLLRHEFDIARRSDSFRATYLTLLRDPIECFESNYVYMGLQSEADMDINQACQLQ